MKMTTNQSGRDNTAVVNEPPVVDAGPNRYVLVGRSVALNGLANDDGLPSNTLDVQWTQMSGPATVTPAAPTSAQTSIVFPAVGEYVLELSADDSARTATDQVVFTVSVAPTGDSTRKLYISSSGSWTKAVREAKTRTKALGYATTTHIGHFDFAIQGTADDRWGIESAANGKLSLGDKAQLLTDIERGSPYSVTWQPNVWTISAADPGDSNHTKWSNWCTQWGNELKQVQDQGVIGQVTCAPGHENAGKYPGVAGHSLHPDYNWTAEQYATWFVGTVQRIRATGADILFMYAPNKPSDDRKEQVVYDSMDAINAQDPSVVDIIAMSYYPVVANAWIDINKGGLLKQSLQYNYDILTTAAPNRTVYLNETGMQRTTKHLDNRGLWYTSNAVNRTEQTQQLFDVASELDITGIKYFNKAKVDKEEFRFLDDAGTGQKRPTDYSLVSQAYAGQYAYVQSEQDTFLRGAADWAGA